MPMRPQKRDAISIEHVRAFTEPGWLKYGMEWVLHPLDDGRTLVETRTLSEPTDASARRRFTAYWTLIRVGSGGDPHRHDRGPAPVDHR